MAALATTALTGAAHAGDYVATYADVTDGTYGVQAGYNAGGSPFQLDTAVSPTEGVTGSVYCPNQGLTSCGYTSTGSNHDLTGTSTSSSNSVTINGSIAPFFSYQSTTDFSGSAAATANLATGDLGAYGTGNYEGQSSSNEPSGVTGTGLAILDDTLHFSVAGATSSTVTDITVSFTMHGNITIGNGLQNYAEGQTKASLNFGNASASATLAVQPGGNVLFTTPTPSGWVSQTETSDAPGDLTFSGVYALDGASSTVDVNAQLLADLCGLGASCNYLDTLQLGLTLPSDVSYTSDSGVFLSDATTDLAGAAPEASTWIMMLLGFAGIGFMGYRKARATPVAGATA